ncbi:kinase-like domain-containing protein [Flammula alnicola]|nr:kinase-like domain-containing protein [Flammula alnicola]
MSVRPGIQTDVIRILGTPVSHYDMIQEGPFATVARTWTAIKDGVPQWVVVKSATTLRKFAREPHDIVKELRLLSSMIHPNIVYTMGSFRDDDQNTLAIYMPFLPISLASLLSSPFFSPHPFPPLRVPDEPTSLLIDAAFCTIAKSIVLQTLCAVAFLHDEQRRIGHRDIKPENIMLTADGRGRGMRRRAAICGPSIRGSCILRCPRAYRAPELLFGTRSYDHLAIDLWSLGATLAEFFTPLRLIGDEDDEEESESESESKSKSIHDDDDGAIGYPGAQWRRDSLFNGERGEIGLAWSIFKIFGTPDSVNWPEFEHLPGATSVVFNVVPAVSLRPLLPNLPPSSLADLASESEDVDLTQPAEAPSDASAEPIQPNQPNQPPSSVLPDPGNAETHTHTPSTPNPTHAHAQEAQAHTPLPLDLIQRFLVYPAAARLRAEDAIRHPWFTAPSSSSSSSIPVTMSMSTSTSSPSAALPTPLPQTPSAIPSTSTFLTNPNAGEWLHSVLLTIPGG